MSTKASKKQILSSLFLKVWLLAPVAIWFSYQPLFKLGRNSSTNFELSITIIYVLLLALSGLPQIWTSRQKLAQSRAAQIAGVFVLISGLSLLWTTNLSRGFLTFGIIGALYAVLLASIAAASQLRKLLPSLTKLFILSAVVMSVLALIQVIAGIWLGREEALLCRGCTANQFGFARPNVFTIEPQFFGNLLLAPALLLFRRVFSKQQTKIEAAGLFLITFALFLSLSRGAIFALAIGLTVLALTLRPKLKGLVNSGAILLASFVVCLLTQGLAAAANPNLSTSFSKAASASINQLTLGVIDIKTNQPVKKKVQPTPKDKTIVNTVPPEDSTPNFTGYVEESTDVRLKLSDLAVRSWNNHPGRIVAGVGLGASGEVLHKEFPRQVNKKEIVQNEYAEVLLENGLLGLLSFVAVIVGLLYSLRRQRWTWAIVVAYLVQWNFFSGYPNALHIYLVFILVYVYSASSKTKA